MIRSYLLNGALYRVQINPQLLLESAISDCRAPKQKQLFNIQFAYIFCWQGSSYIGLPSESYELFVTSAPQDGVKLWDTRTAK